MIPSRRESYIGVAAVTVPQQQVARRPVVSENERSTASRSDSAASTLVNASYTLPEPVRSHTAREASAQPLLQTGRTISQTITYSYDPLYRLKSAAYGDGTNFAYTYDAVGNRLTETVTGGVTTTYTYDVANRLASVNGVPYTWDNNGNLLSDGENTYIYDQANRLVSVIRSGMTASYQYNGLGDRVSETNNGVTTNFTLDLNAGLTQVLADGTNTYLYGTVWIGQFTASDSAYFLGDVLGSVRQLVDGAGVVTMAKNYEPYGELLKFTGEGNPSRPVRRSVEMFRGMQNTRTYIVR